MRGAGGNKLPQSDIVDATTIALVKPKFGTKMPDCLLNEARKDPWELPIEGLGINSQGDLLDKQPG